MDIVRVLRVIEYVGPRDRVEQVVAGSIHGDKDAGGGLLIRAGTIGAYPEIMDANGRLVAFAERMLDVLLRANDAIESLDGTSVENERLVDDYRAVVAEATGAPPPTQPHNQEPT